MPPIDVAIVGGGVIGLSIAFELAELSARTSCELTVSVFDPEPGKGTSRVAAGMLAPVTELHFSEEKFLPVTIAASAMYPEFVERVEAASGLKALYSGSGTLTVAKNASDMASLSQLLDLQESCGLLPGRMTPSAIRSAEPSLSTSLAGGFETPTDHQVDPRLLVIAMLGACEALGVRFVQETVAKIDKFDDGYEVSASRKIPSRFQSVVLCTGAALRDGTPAMPRVPSGIDPSIVEIVSSIRPVKGQVIRLGLPDSRSAFLPRLPRAVVRGLVDGRSVYIVPRASGEVVVGATSEDLGFDLNPTGGAVHQLLHDARSILPMIDELDFREVSVGLRPGTPDNFPVVGPIDQENSCGRLYIANGHYRNGILLAPLTARLIAWHMNQDCPKLFPALFKRSHLNLDPDSTPDTSVDGGSSTMALCDLADILSPSRYNSGQIPKVVAQNG